MWEFPGGKLEPGESAEAALRRELYEELGIKAATIAGLVDVRHDYQDKRLLCRVWRVYAWRGDIRARENQALSWAPLDKLERYAFPEANRAILAALRLPPVYLISEPSCEDKGRCLAVLEQCLRAGLRLFQLRMEAPGGQPDEALFIAELKPMLGRYAAKLIINGAPAAMRKYQADGIHLNSRALFRYSSRPVAADRLLGASCHNEREIARAVRIGADYIFISPVKPTKSHPGSKAIGWQRFESLCRFEPGSGLRAGRADRGRPARRAEKRRAWPGPAQRRLGCCPAGRGDPRLYQGGTSLNQELRAGLIRGFPRACLHYVGRPVVSQTAPIKARGARFGHSK